MSYQPQQIPSLASEIYIKNVGDTFTASPLATHRGEYRVCERYAQAGFCYYNCVPVSFAGDYKRENSIVFRNKDIEMKKSWTR